MFEKSYFLFNKDIKKFNKIDKTVLLLVPNHLSTIYFCNANYNI